MLPSTYLNYHLVNLNGLDIACDGLRDHLDIEEDTCLTMVLLSNFTLSSSVVFVFLACTSSASFLGRPRALRFFGELGVSGSFGELDVSDILHSTVPIISWTSSCELIGSDAMWASYVPACTADISAFGSVKYPCFFANRYGVLVCFHAKTVAIWSQQAWNYFPAKYIYLWLHLISDTYVSTSFSHKIFYKKI